MTPPVPTLWTDEFLDAKRKIGDPLADAVITAIGQYSQRAEVDQLFRLLARNNTYTEVTFAGLHPAVQEALRTYFSQSARLPDWADLDRVNFATVLFEEHLPKILLILHCKSLPISYTCRKGAKVLHQAGRMLVRDGSLRPFTRRLYETAQFVDNLLTANGFDVTGNAIVTIQKVRLMHAAIRFYTKQHGLDILETGQNVPWDVAEMGEPINQEDLALGLITFGTTIVEGLRQLGIDVSPEQEDCYLHLWQVAGHVLGIQDDLIARNQADGLYLLDRMMTRQAEPSVEGTELTEACILFLDDKFSVGPFKKTFTPRLMRFFVGDASADLLRIPEKPGQTAEEAAAADAGLRLKGQHLDEAAERNLLLKLLARTVINGSVDTFLNLVNTSADRQFVTPASLTDTVLPDRPASVEFSPARTLTGAIAALEDLTLQFKRENNPLGFFTITLRRMAQRLPAEPFADPARVEGIFTKTLDRFLAAEPQRSSAPEAWQRVFGLATTRLSLDQVVYAAAAVSLGYDLPQVAAAQGSELGPAYRQLATLFRRVYADLSAQLDRAYPTEALLDLVSGPARRWEAGAFDGFLAEAGRVFSENETAPQALVLAQVERIVAPPWPLRPVLQRLARREFPEEGMDRSAAAKMDGVLAGERT